MKAATIFAGIGIDECYLGEIGIDVVISNELIKSRAEAHKHLYPTVEMLQGDITDKDTQRVFIDKCKKECIDLIIATPPCQGVSMAGFNKTDKSILNDPRNYLVMAALDIFDEIQCNYMLIENVPRFERMVYPCEKRYVSLEELLKIKYANDYNVDCRIFNSANYGVPQNRLRIVYRIWKKGMTWNDPIEQNLVTLRDAIGGLPSIEASEDSGIKNHYARKHPDNHIECMKYTPEGKSAFDNEEHFPKKANGEPIKGFKNTYKRMRWDVPAPTITMRNEIVSSQENVHPGRPLEDGLWSDARVLTLRELLIVSSMPPDMDIPSNLSETAFRQLIGEGIPPLLIKQILLGIGEIHERY